MLCTPEFYYMASELIVTIGIRFAESNGNLTIEKFHTIKYRIMQNILVLKSNTNVVLNVLFTVSKLYSHTLTV